MRDRKFLLVLLLTAAVGSAVTLCTGFVTGGLNWGGQVTVTLADEAEQPSDELSAAGMAVNVPVENAVSPIPETAADPQGSGQTAAAAETAEETTVFEEAPAQEAAAEEEAEAAEEAAGEAGGEGSEADAAPAVYAEGAADAVPPDEGDAAGQEVRSEKTSAAAAGKAPVAEAAQDSEGNVALSPLETAAESGDTTEYAAVIAEATDGGAVPETENPYRNRLEELDAQIQKSRESQNVSNTAGGGPAAKNTASNELKLWDSELNTIYSRILKSLDEKQTQQLVAAERQWLKNRDAAAVNAAKNSAGGSLESVEYTASLAESTRARAYELVELYAAVLTE